MDGAGHIPFHLRGNYAPVPDEVTLSDLKVEGAIPPALNGVYLRNGPNPSRAPSPHWFVGDGMLHGVRLENGRAAWYRNRHSRTRVFAGEERNRALMDRTMTTANTHIVRHAGRFFALEEGAFPFEVTGALESIGPHDFAGKLTTAFTAHPKICPETGEMHAFGYGFMPPFLTYHVIEKDGRLAKSVEIPLRASVMAHDFGMTRHHVIFMDLPITFDLELAMRGRFPYVWNDTHGARLGVMPRGGDADQIRWAEIEPCYVFHPANAYEENGAIVMDVCRYPSLWRGKAEDFDSASKLHRWRIDLASMRVSEEPLDDLVSEFPRIDDRRAGLKNRIVFAAAARGRSLGEDADHFDRVLRFDRQTGERQVKAFGAQAMASEFAFAAGGPGEGEGWLMGFVYDAGAGTSDLVILEADTLAETARVKLPRRVPQGFHGDWFAD
ncbi:MAG: carotenoid oxygenase family protein [Hydrogenophilaceae bacterium]|jgi:carotenoid cleavage dioxygenase|nr:carotenoid oxygenase family protein [Hydrogenophilaceae bacterium]